MESDLQLSISSKVHREDEVNFENEVVEDTPTRISICDGEKEINLENLIVEETPPNSSICDKVEQEMNREDDEFHAEKLIMEEDNPTSLGMQELNAESEKLIVEDTPPKLSFYDVRFYSFCFIFLGILYISTMNPSSHIKQLL